MSQRSSLIVGERPSPRPKRRAGVAPPLSKKKRPSPRSAEKMARPRRRLGIAADTGGRRAAKRRNQREDKDEAAVAAAFEEFHKDLKRLISWLTSAIDQSEQWKAPSNSTLSNRVQLEKYLAFAMELQTHEQLKDNVIRWGRELASACPQLQANMEATVDLVASQYGRLEERLDSRYEQLEEALSTLETNVRSDSKSLRSFDAELIMDSVDQMSLRLQNSKRRNSLMEVNIKALNKQVGTFNSSNKLLSSGGSDTSCSSSPDFDVLYEELSDWLSELHMAVTDSQKGQSEQRTEQMFKAYNQELQLREVTRSRLNRKGDRLLARQTSSSSPCALPDRVTAKLQALNQQWASLQSRLAPWPPAGATVLLPAATSAVSPAAASPPRSPSLPVFASSEEVMTVTLEVEEVIVQLKGWLTEMERKLFAAESLKCPGSVQQMEKRLEAHKELQADVAKNSEGIQVVLNMCDILQRDTHACASEKERESLQLAALTLEGRWQAIQAQAMALQCSLEEKLRTFKGDDTVLDKGPQHLAKSEPASADGKSKQSPTAQPTGTSVYRPSGAQDDSVLYRLANDINYDDILLVREAFSENDAFSISDASEVSLADFAFDDVLPLKGEEEEEDEELLAQSVPAQTPDIMELSDEMIEAYLRMEEEQLRLEEEEEEEAEVDAGILPDMPEVRGRSCSELEFWSMSPRDEPLLTQSVELPQVMPSLEDLDQEPVLLCKGHGASESPSFSVSPDYQPIDLGKYNAGAVGYMSSVLEDTLESLYSDDSDFGEADVNEADDEGEGEVDVTLTEERCQNGARNEEDEALANLLFDMDDLDGAMVASPPAPSMPAKRLSQSLPLTHRTRCEVDLPTHDYPASYPSQPASITWSHPSVTIAKSPCQNRGFFPSRAGCLLPNPFEEFATSSPAKPTAPTSTDDTSAALRNLRRRLSQVSSVHGDEEQKRRQQAGISPSPPQDHLLEITDLSLSHMYESLDFVTELTNSLMPAAQPVGDGAESPVAFPLLEAAEDLDSDSDSDSFSDSSEGIEREDLVQRWINENMPTPPEVIPLQMPPELPFCPLGSLQAACVQDIPTRDLPSLPVCDLEEVGLGAEALSDALLLSHPGPGIAPVQEADGFLEAVCGGQEASRGHRTDAEEEEALGEAEEEVTLSPAKQEVMNQSLLDSSPHKGSQTLLPEAECVASDATDATDASSAACAPADGATLDFSAIKERLRREIMEQPDNKRQAYFTYVSRLAQSCAPDAPVTATATVGDLGQVLEEFSSQKCHLWAIGGAADQPRQPTSLADDLPEPVIANWPDLDSQCSDDTDRLLEASNSLVEELERGAHLQPKSMPEDEIGSWRDVIVLWLDEQDKAVGVGSQAPDSYDGERESGDQTAKTSAEKSLDATDDGIIPDASLHASPLDIAECVDYINQRWEPSADLIDSGNFSADGTLEDESILNEVQDSAPASPAHLTSTPQPASAEDDRRARPSLTASPICLAEVEEVTSGEASVAAEPARTSSRPEESGFLSRAFCLGLPICIFLFLCVLLILLLPAVIVSTTGECSLSLTDNLLLHSPSWEPLLRYVRGPPPQ